MRRFGILAVACLALAACGGGGGGSKDGASSDPLPPSSSSEAADPSSQPEDPPPEPADPAPEPADPALESADPAPEPADPARQVLWSAGMEDGTLDEWSFDEGGHLANSGVREAIASTDVARTGTQSLRATIWTPSLPKSGVRAFRYLEPSQHRELYFSAWFFIPRSFEQTGEGLYWNVFQFKSTPIDRESDPLWVFDLIKQEDSTFRVRAVWGAGGTTAAGPFEGSGVGEQYFSNNSTVGFSWPGEPSTTTPVPIGEWFELRAFLRQSKDFDGRLTFWLNGEDLFDFESIRTAYPNAPAGQSWGGNNGWSVNNYSDGLDPSPATIYIDDAEISIP